MSIPERLYRLAKGKIGEIRELFDQDEEDAELDPEVIARRQRAQARKSARREVDDALDPYIPPAAAATSPSPPRAAQPIRTPEEIMRGARSNTSPTYTAPAAAPQSVEADPLAPHYRLLGLEPGTDLATVQAVYEKLEARCKPDLFPADSADAVKMQEIRTDLEAAYKALRQALDPTARRFDMLEL